MLTQQIMLFVEGAWSPAHDFAYSEYFRCVVLLTALGEFEFLFTDSDVLTDAKSDRRPAYRAMPPSHSVPDDEYIRIRHLSRRHASGAVDRIVISPDEPRHYVDVSVRVFVSHVFVQLFADRAKATSHYSAFHIRVSRDLKFNALLS